MPLDQIANIAEITAAALVIVSLIYVGVGVRHNARALQLGTTQSVSQEVRRAAAEWASSPHLVDSMLKGMADPNIDGRDKLGFYLVMANLVRVYENGYFQFDAGALDSRVWTGMQRQFADLMSAPGARVYWAERKHWYSDDFQRYFEGQIVPSADPEYRLAGT